MNDTMQQARSLVEQQEQAEAAEKLRKAQFVIEHNQVMAATGKAMTASARSARDREQEQARKYRAAVDKDESLRRRARTLPRVSRRACDPS